MSSYDIIDDIFETVCLQQKQMNDGLIEKGCKFLLKTNLTIRRNLVCNILPFTHSLLGCIL